ncbi:MAG: hypothetical protein AABX47_08955 [Nanoarchaeota archaeon]
MAERYPRDGRFLDEGCGVFMEKRAFRRIDMVEIDTTDMMLLRPLDDMACIEILTCVPALSSTLEGVVS